MLVKSSRDNLNDDNLAQVPAIDTGTGALNASLVIEGGADVKETLKVGSNASPEDANWANNRPNRGELLVKGGSVLDKKVWLRGSGGAYDLTGSENVTETAGQLAEGGLQVDGGARFKQAVRINGKADVDGITTIHDTKEVDNATKKGAFTLYGGGYVHKDFTVRGNMNVLNNLNVIGNVTAINTDQVIVDDPLIVLGLNQTDSSNIFDSGILSRYTSAGGLKFTGLVKDGSGEYSLVTEIPQKAGKPLEADLQTAYFTTEAKLENLNMKQLKVKSSLESSATNGGALIVTGGVGISKNMNVAGSVVVTGGTTQLNNATDSVKPTGANADNNGSFMVQGGASIRKNLNVLGSAGVYGDLLVNDTKSVYLSEDKKQYIVKDAADKLTIRAESNILLQTNGGQVRVPKSQKLQFNETTDTEYIVTDNVRNLKINSQGQIILKSTNKTSIDC